MLYNHFVYIVTNAKKSTLVLQITFKEGYHNTFLTVKMLRNHSLENTIATTWCTIKALNPLKRLFFAKKKSKNGAGQKRTN